MLKIITVLATTFLFAGLLIAHPYTSPAVGPAGETAKVAAVAPADGQPSQSVAEPGPAPSKTTALQDVSVVGPSAGNADTSVAAGPQLEQPRLQTPRPPPDNRYATVNAGIPGYQTQSPVALRPQSASPTYGPTPVNASVAARRDGRHWSQQADSAAGRIDPPSTAPSIRIVYSRPMPLEQRIHLQHNNRYNRQ